MALDWTAPVRACQHFLLSNGLGPWTYMSLTCQPDIRGHEAPHHHHHVHALDRGFQARSKDQEILEEGGGAGPSS